MPAFQLLGVFRKVPITRCQLLIKKCNKMLIVLPLVQLFRLNTDLITKQFYRWCNIGIKCHRLAIDIADAIIQGFGKIKGPQAAQSHQRILSKRIPNFTFIKRLFAGFKIQLMLGIG